MADSTDTSTPKTSTADTSTETNGKGVVAKGIENAKSAAAQGWSDHVVPVKAQAEKAVKAASDKLSTVDWKTHVDPIKEQAGKTAMSAAIVAKDKTGSAMQSLAKLISDTASTVDAKLGPQYGDYARQAAEQVAGAAHSLEEKDVDQLLAEAKDFVRKSPAVAIGAAAIVGFVLMRLAKGSGDEA